MTADAAPTARRPRSRSRAIALARDFYDRATEDVARDLLGAILECRGPDGVAAGRIVETEAYLGPHDPACHAAAGLTARTRVLHGAPGLAYVYFIYGTNWCVNAVTREEGHGSAVLIRALEPLRGLALMRARRAAARRDRDLTNGPGKLCRALGIDARHNGVRLDRGALRIVRGDDVPDASVLVTPRIGITRASEWPLRYLVRDSRWVSATPRAFPVTPFVRSGG